MDSPIATLRNSPLFAKIPDDSLIDLGACARVAQAEPGDYIFHDGDPGHSLYLIQQGTVSIVKQVDQQEILLTLLQPGAIFGEMAMLEDAPRSASARAVTSVTLIELAKPDVIRVMQSQPNMMYDIVQLLSNRLRVSDFSRIAELERKNIELRQAYQLLNASYEATLIALCHALDLRDRATEGHSVRVTDLSLLIADALDIDATTREALRLGAILHDVGKIGVPDHILRKPGPLNPAEWEIMRHHPAWGKEIISHIEFLKPATDVVYSHHERMLGQGYPLGLRANDIPLGARIFAIADTFDALISTRPYKSPISPEAARDEIVRCANELFDPMIVAAFERAFPQILIALHDKTPDWANTLR